MSEEPRFWPDLPILGIEEEQARKLYPDMNVRFLLPDRSLPPGRAPVVLVYPPQPWDLRITRPGAWFYRRLWAWLRRE